MAERGELFSADPGTTLAAGGRHGDGIFGMGSGRWFEDPTGVHEGTSWRWRYCQGETVKPPLTDQGSVMAGRGVGHPCLPTRPLIGGFNVLGTNQLFLTASKKSRV